MRECYFFTVTGEIDVNDYAGTTKGAPAEQWTGRWINPETDDIDKMTEDIIDWIMTDYPGIERYSEFTYLRNSPMPYGKVFKFSGVIRVDSRFVESFFDAAIRPNETVDDIIEILSNGGGLRVIGWERITDE